MADQNKAAPLPKWIDDMKGSDPTMDGVIEYLEKILARQADPEATSEQMGGAQVALPEGFVMVPGLESPQPKADDEEEPSGEDKVTLDAWFPDTAPTTVRAAAPSDLIALAVRDVCELDYSGEDHIHDNLLCVAVDDLTQILSRHFAAPRAAEEQATERKPLTEDVAPADAVRDARNENTPLPTDISKRLRECANAVMLQVDRAKLMLTAADECERYYGGMVTWKETAQAKDRVNVEAYAHKIAKARIAALEEAAKWHDAMGINTSGSRAAYVHAESARAIRAMKSTPKEPV